MTQLFISYAHADQIWADAFAARLADFGYTVWMDHQSLLPAEDWGTAIEKGIETSALVLVIVTAASAASPYVRKEMDHANAQTKPIPLLPIVLSEAEFKKMPTELQKQQWVKFEGKGFDTVISKLAVQLKDKGFPPLKEWDIEKYRNDDNITMAKLKTKWSSTHKDFDGVGGKSALIGLPFARSEYGAIAYLVAPGNCTLETPQKIHVFLDFSGSSRAPFNKYCDYIQATTKKQTQFVVLIYGPCEDDERVLPNDVTVWKNSVEFVKIAIDKIAEGRTFQFFLDTPTAFAMMLGVRLKQDASYHFEVFHYLEGKTDPTEHYFELGSV